MYSYSLSINQIQLNRCFEQSDVSDMTLLMPALPPSNRCLTNDSISGYEGYWFSSGSSYDWMDGSEDVHFTGRDQCLNSISPLSTTPGLGKFYQVQGAGQWNSINKQINRGSANVHHKDEGIPVM